MEHAALLPILIPFVTAVIMLGLSRTALPAIRMLSLGSALALVLVAAHLLARADSDTILVYALGNWPAPYGIVLVLDRLAALLLMLTAVVGSCALLRATAGTDARGRFFHPFFQLQLAGLNGAFLTGDLFNLFVFFEILLLASYALLMHGAAPGRTRPALLYVVLNLTGSALFLIALALLYGMLGTLNLADLAILLPDVPPADQAIVSSAFALLLVVFLLKAAIMPLCLWLPHAYTAASAPVVALFAVLTKVGVYSVLRITRTALDGAPFTAALTSGWLTVAALATIAIGVLGAIAAERFARLVANLVLVSTGVLIAALSMADVATDAGALYYLVHSTVITAALFLLAEQLARGRGPFGDTLARGPAPVYVPGLGLRFLLLAVAVSGVPPLSGFIGKLMLMRAVQTTEWGPALWVALLLSGFAVALVLARAASVLFWETRSSALPTPAHAGTPARGGTWPLDLLLAAAVLLVLAAAPITSYTHSAARQLETRTAYAASVLDATRETLRERRP